ncbi:hypothetical protein [Ilumatobacter sp.]|uniref:hypothetical protein n=1 Tax=Ilumatobacter sp. TaxID=1967498 RepID=UPI003750EE11
MTVKRISRRASQRKAKELIHKQLHPDPLPPALQQRLVEYTLSGVDDMTWAAVRPVLIDVMQHSHIVGEASFGKHLGVVAKYLAYRHTNVMSLAIPDAFNIRQIDHYYLNAITDAQQTTRNDYRSRLTNIAKRVNAGSGAPLTTPTIGRRSVRPGYTSIEEAAIIRCSLRQSSRVVRRQLCAIVGLCAGAGLDSTDLRHLESQHIVDHGQDGIEVTVAVGRVRTVFVRRRYEELVRIGIEALSSGQLVLGEHADRRNITTGIIARADLYDAPSPDASRLRSTWLTWLLTQPVPIQLIMQAAGLQTARSLTELIAQLPDVDAGATRDLRGSQS